MKRLTTYLIFSLLILSIISYRIISFYFDINGLGIIIVLLIMTTICFINFLVRIKVPKKFTLIDKIILFISTILFFNYSISLTTLGFTVQNFEGLIFLLMPFLGYYFGRNLTSKQTKYFIDTLLILLFLATLSIHFHDLIIELINKTSNSLLIKNDFDVQFYIFETNFTRMSGMIGNYHEAAYICLLILLLKTSELDTNNIYSKIYIIYSLFLTLSRATILIAAFVIFLNLSKYYKFFITILISIMAIVFTKLYPLNEIIEKLNIEKRIFMFIDALSNFFNGKLLTIIFGQGPGYAGRVAIKFDPNSQINIYDNLLIIYLYQGGIVLVTSLFILNIIILLIAKRNKVEFSSKIYFGNLGEFLFICSMLNLVSLFFIGESLANFQFSLINFIILGIFITHLSNYKNETV